MITSAKPTQKKSFKWQNIGGNSSFGKGTIFEYKHTHTHIYVYMCVCVYVGIYVYCPHHFLLFSLSNSKPVLTTNVESASVLITGFNFLLLGDISPLNQCLRDWSPGEFHPISCFIMKDSYSPTRHVSTVIYINFSVLKCCTVPSDMLEWSVKFTSLNTLTVIRNLTLVRDKDTS